ncbi:GDSL-like Lipase/Acylhydrolase family protein [Lentzea albidocapillata subsp. violacea]|uniref:GDSL-like Lipase/Acylhydrolase family protein n=1 Tax=Lentzea albidocapillata subsp. violacea TaxID=128104 RepID=A0A1G9G9Z2_9PSEU|nr:SGNH/GDSL hydrolase family protein [Lentzea albidocapillata]SDK97093.1 GDSL-like Lipase/Acylhydrolase family protein [Lentzea albidocapillata subsp. violacea]
MRIVAGLAVAAMLVAGTSTAQADTLEYVALGDSAAAGPLIPNQDPALWCLRSSNNNYPQIAAKILNAKLTDVTCSGAKTDDFAGRQFGFVAPQYDALKSTTDLVSITIGGNDVGLVQTALSCINLLPEPVGLSCKARLTAGGDQVAAAIGEWAPEFGAALDEVKRRAPHAKILVTGYGTYIRPGGCYPVQPIWARDADYLQGSVDLLSATAKAEAEKRGATYVDLAAVSVGHDTCAKPADRYLEGLIPTTIAAPLHPNAAGMAAFGATVARAARPGQLSAA